MSLETKGELEKIIQALEVLEISIHAVVQSGEPLEGMDIFVGFIAERLACVVEKEQ